MTVFWVVASCSLVEFYRRVRGVCFDHLDDGGSKYIWNVGKLLPDYTVTTTQKTAIFRKRLSSLIYFGILLIGSANVLWSSVRYHCINPLSDKVENKSMSGKCQVILLKHAGSHKNSNESETTVSTVLKLIEELADAVLCFHSIHVLIMKPSPVLIIFNCESSLRKTLLSSAYIWASLKEMLPV
jgi:hypothetical protein